MSGLWSAQQREWLQAMGHTVMTLAGSEPSPAEAPIANAAPDAARSEELSARAPQPTRERPASESAASERAAAEPAQTAPRAAVPGDDTPALLRNLLRAARRAAGDAQVLALFDASALRANPAAKRALWPQLRKLRRTDNRG